MQVGATTWGLMAAIVVLNTVAQSLLKLGAGRSLVNVPLAGGVVAYGLSTLLYVLVLGKTNLSFSYPVVIGATAIATCLAGVILLGERIAGGQWFGIALIIVGIIFIAVTRTPVR
ncbi:MAG TPA: SMR family transporter [Polyangia bacterium]|jgi:multidrug transporter EmrE-like cation transporter|nr:SMR family transporter [Polyangia bacterium]